jgi:hypothetical protein
MIAMTAGLACDAQVGDEYIGETILSLQGNVRLRDAEADTNLLPALVFFGPGGAKVVGGETTGEFPSRFRFDVSRPPPSDAYLPAQPGENVNGKRAIGFIAMLPPNPPGTLANTSLESECNDDFTQCNSVRTSCDDNKICRVRTYECTKRPCELLSEVGEPVDPRDFGSVSSESSCFGDTCYTISSECGLAGDCHVRFSQCEITSSADLVFSDGTIEHCDLIAESGDSSIVGLDDIKTVASNYYVIYATKDSPDAVPGPLKKGYNLVEILAPTAEEWVTREVCELDAKTGVVGEYNAEHGTAWNWYDGPEELRDLVDQAVEEECAEVVRSQIVETPSAAELTIEVGSSLPL